MCRLNKFLSFEWRNQQCLKVFYGANYAPDRGPISLASPSLMYILLFLFISIAILLNSIRCDVSFDEGLLNRPDPLHWLHAVGGLGTVLIQQIVSAHEELRLAVLTRRVGRKGESRRLSVLGQSTLWLESNWSGAPTTTIFKLVFYVGTQIDAASNLHDVLLAHSNPVNTFSDVIIQDGVAHVAQIAVASD